MSRSIGTRLLLQPFLGAFAYGMSRASCKTAALIALRVKGDPSRFFEAVATELLGLNEPGSGALVRMAVLCANSFNGISKTWELILELAEIETLRKVGFDATRIDSSSWSLSETGGYRWCWVHRGYPIRENMWVGGALEQVYARLLTTGKWLPLVPDHELCLLDLPALGSAGGKWPAPTSEREVHLYNLPVEGWIVTPCGAHRGVRVTTDPIQITCRRCLNHFVSTVPPRRGGMACLNLSAHLREKLARPGPLQPGPFLPDRTLIGGAL